MRTWFIHTPGWWILVILSLCILIVYNIPTLLIRTSDNIVNEHWFWVPFEVRTKQVSLWLYMWIHIIYQYLPQSIDCRLYYAVHVLLLSTNSSFLSGGTKDDVFHNAVNRALAAMGGPPLNMFTTATPTITISATVMPSRTAHGLAN